MNNKEIILILFIFTMVYSFNLDKYPYIWCDESFFSNPAFTFATQGFLGTTMVPNFSDMAHFTYWQPPVYFLLLSTSFKLFGFGIIQARIVSLLLGFFTVLFTYLLASELFNKKIGVLSSILLITNQVFFFVSRDVRMDIAVACFTLIAIYFLLLALKNSRHIYYFYSGLFSILSLFSHPNGLFGLISIIILFCMCKIDFKNLKPKFKLKEILYFSLGPILLTIPYLYYISLNFPAFIGQFKSNILDSSNGILHNVLSEFIRYGCLIYFYKDINGWIIAIIFSLTSVFLAIFGLHYIFKNRRKFSSKFLAILLSVHLFLFAVLVSQKYSMWYFGIILPYWSILIAILFKKRFNYKKSIQTIIMVLLLVYIAINAIGISNIFITSYDNNPLAIQYEVQKYVPNGSIIVGDATYWFNLHNYYTYYDYGVDDSTFKKSDVEYILYDSYWATHPNSIDLKEFIENNCTLIGEISPNSSIKLTPIKIYKINN